jgi:toxin ParE1/3/4
MARRVVWSPEAVEDLEAIGAYIEFPELGRVVPEIDDASIRERFIHSYRVIYRNEDDRILIAAIIHGGRLLYPFSQQIKGNQGPGS